MAANMNELSSLQEEVGRLRLENKKLARELRLTQSYLDKVNRMMNTKSTLESALQAANTRQRTYTDIILESCPNIMLLLDDESRLVLSTQMFLTLTGIPNFDYIKNRTLGEVLAPYLPPKALDAAQNDVAQVIRTGKTVTYSRWVDFEQNGHPRCYTIELIAIGHARGAGAGISAGILAVLVDVTDFIRERQRAEDASNAKSDFLASMSHEIRTPMNAILGLSEVLERSELDPVQKKHLSDIRRSAQSLLGIINDILDFSKIEAGKMDIARTEFDLRGMLAYLHDLFAPMFADKQLAFSLHLADNLPARVCGDEARLRQVFTNLLSNALKYTQEGRVALYARLDEGAALLRFDVEDTGIGVRREDLDRLFTPFEQLDKARNKGVVGTGLGLTISHELSRLMGGDLWAESRYGEGSVFSVTLPYLAACEEGAPLPPQEAPLFTAPDARVLVVDDIEINLSVAEAMLDAFAIRPDLAGSGEEAVRMAAATRYDLIFMDHMMPDMDGVEATRLIRCLDGGSAAAPIVALTANVLKDAQEMFLQNQIDDFLAKPLELSALNTCLRRWLPPQLMHPAEQT